MLAPLHENQIQSRCAMKIRILLLVSSLGLLILAVGCSIPLNSITGSGRMTTETRSVSNFDGVTLAGFGDLTIIQGDSESLTVQAEDNILPYITTQVANGTLVIGYDTRYGSDWIRPTQPIKFNLALKNLNTLELSGAGNIQSASLTSDQLVLRVSGAGNIKIDKLEAKELTTSLSGAGNLNIAGQAASLDSRLTGLGSLQAGNLKSQSAKVTISGAGSATMAATESLDVTLSGIGSVEYYGNPKVTQKVSGIGSVKSLGK
jgi:hypothetical protein